MAPALHRHLRERPSVETGLSLTEQFVLQVLSERSLLQGRLLAFVMVDREPLPWIGDPVLMDLIYRMERASEKVMTRAPQAGSAACTFNPVSRAGVGTSPSATRFFRDDLLLLRPGLP
jgi:hypothetical protein